HELQKCRFEFRWRHLESVLAGRRFFTLRRCWSQNHFRWFKLKLQQFDLLYWHKPKRQVRWSPCKALATSLCTNCEPMFLHFFVELRRCRCLMCGCIPLA